MLALAVLAASVFDAGAGQNSSCVLLGFRLEDGAGNVNTYLEGIVERRRRIDGSVTTQRLYWSDNGERLQQERQPDFDVYCFRVAPGEMGIGGFLLNRDKRGEGPLARFSRFFEVPAGKEAWLGVFAVTQAPGQMVSVVIEPKPEFAEKLRQIRRREVVAVEGRHGPTPMIAPAPK